MTRIDKNSKQLHIVSNGKLPMAKLADILSEIHPYVSAIHLREKQKSARELYQAICLFKKKKVPLSKIIINDRIDVALVTGVKGVQLAFHSLETSVVKANFPQLTIGCSVHSVSEGQKAQQDGADYVIYGHIFPTRSKPGLQPRGLNELKKITSSIDLPVIAIGGITPENSFKVIQNGANGIAVMSGILEARNPLSAAQNYNNMLEIGDGYSEKFF